MLTRQHHHVDGRQLGEGQDRVAAPFLAGHGRRFEADLLLEYAAGGLNDIAVDLVAHAFGVDHHPGVMPDHHAGDGDFTGTPVNGHVSHPRRPCGAKAWEFTVDVARIGKAAPAQYVTFALALHGLGVRLPVGAGGGGLDQVDGTRVGQVLEPIFHRIDTRCERQLIDVRFVGKAVGHGRHTAHPRASEQQGQGRRAVGRIAGLEVIGSHAAIFVQAAVDLHQLCSAFGFPGVFLLAGQLYPHGA